MDMATIREAAVLGFLIAIASAAAAQPSMPSSTILRKNDLPATIKWSWIEVEPSADSRAGWITVTGTGTVHIQSRQFHADLRLTPGEQGADISLDGVIAKGRIRATEVLLNTDAGPAKIVGTLRRHSLGRAVEEWIAFRGGQSGDLSYLALYRIIAARTQSH